MTEKKEPYEIDVDKFEERQAKETLPEVSDNSFVTIFQIASQRGYEPAFIEKMMELQERYDAKEARKAFYLDLAAFKEVAVKVSKDKDNKQFGSKYTSLGNLLDTLNPVLGQYGLSISFPTPAQTDKELTVECKLSHRLGHSESVTMTAPIDAAPIGKESGRAARNPIQNIKSTFTYLRSATCEAILGVAGTEATLDDDGKGTGGETQYIDDKQLGTIVDMMNAKNMSESRMLKFMDVEKLENILASDYKKAVEGIKATKKHEKKPDREVGQEG